MRSRFAAFVRGEHTYLFRTLHADHDDHPAGAAALAAQLTKNAKRTRYDALIVLEHDGADADEIARVLFHVTMRLDGRDASFARNTRASPTTEPAGATLAGRHRALRAERARGR